MTKEKPHINEREYDVWEVPGIFIKIVRPVTKEKIELAKELLSLGPVKDDD